ncbi:MAG: universal stress protein [Solirubrobacterales bacterium]
MRLLIGVDKREGGKDALELARVLAAGGETSALVVTVLFTGPLPMEYALLPAEEEAESEALFAQARQALSGVEVETHAYGGGSPAGILTTLAEREELDAIVVGSPHRGAFGRVLAGSVATSLLNGAPTDVAIAPRGYARARHEPLGEIAVGYDGAPESQLALRRAEAWAARSGAGLELITVVTPPVAAPVMAPGVYVPQSPAEPEKVLDTGVASVDSKLTVKGVRLAGDPAAELSEHCDEGVDLLVVGSRGYGPLARVLLGSVSRQLVQRAPCPVLVASRP